MPRRRGVAPGGSPRPTGQVLPLAVRSFGERPGSQVLIPPTRGDARLRGPPGDLVGFRTCGRPDTQDPRRGGCFAVRSGAEQREKNEENRENGAFRWMDQGWEHGEIEGWKSNPRGGQAERSLSGTLLSKRSAPPKKVPKFYYGHCFVLCSSTCKRLFGSCCICITARPLLSGRLCYVESVWVYFYICILKTSSQQNREEQNSLQNKEAFQISTKKIKSKPEGNRSLRRQ